MGNFWYKCLAFLNWIFSIALLVACIVRYTASGSLSLLSLTVPLLVGINILFIFYWLFKRKSTILVSLLVVAFTFYISGPFVNYTPKNKDFDKSKTLKLLTFNGLGFRGKEDLPGNKVSDSIIAFVENEAPDIVTFQEFSRKRVTDTHLTAYPYNYIDYEPSQHYGRVVLAIYSKYKIIEKGFLEFPDSRNSAVFADLVINKDTVRVYNLHLESLRIRPSSIEEEASDRLFYRVRNSFRKQQKQAQIVRSHMNTSPYRSIVCGDFNNSQFSNVYRIVRGELKDSFLEKGHGYGSTIAFLGVPFRIDFILTDPSIKVIAHQNYTIGLSDHEPVSALVKITVQE